MKRCLVIALLLFPLIAAAQSKTPGEIVTEYDRFRDQTTVRLRPISVSPNLSVSLIAAFRGKRPTKGILVDLQIIHRGSGPKFGGRANTTLYLIIDGERFSPGADVRDAMPGPRDTYIDSLTFHLLHWAFSDKLLNAQSAEARLAGIEFRFTPEVQAAMKRFMETLNQ